MLDLKAKLESNWPIRILAKFANGLNDQVVGGSVAGIDPRLDFRGVAQLAEHRFPKPGVAGSIPAAPAKSS